jgi:hypothetical protein
MINPDEAQRAAGILTPEDAADFTRRFGFKVSTQSDVLKVLAMLNAEREPETEQTAKRERRK